MVYAHHLGVPARPLELQATKSLPPKGKKPSLDDNLIIHGDNLQALKALLPRYASKVNCIYIDPPYNTGNESWIYNDNVNSPQMKEWFKHNSPVDGDDLERHDKWLCMIWPRLQLLKELLADDGAIFISIDDNEQSHLRLIMDEIFGREHFVAQIIWRKKAGGGQDSEYFAREHEYILCYRKSEAFKMIQRTTPITEKDFSKSKNDRACKFIPLEKWGANALRTDRPTMYYSINDPDGNDFFPMSPSMLDGNWRKNPTKLDKDHIHWEWDKKRNRWRPYEVQYFDESKPEKIQKERTIYYDIATTADATKEQTLILGGKKMDNTKPVDLIHRLCAISTDKEAVILDSFAGSGTTAHAVLSLNKEDQGNRKFILIECEDYADAITAKRVSKVIKGVKNSKEEKLQKGLGGSFTFCTLGNELGMEKMLKGKELPDFETLARHLFWTATGQSIETIRKARGNDGFFYETNSQLFYLVYEPNLDFLRSSSSALNDERANRISKKAISKSKTAVVFASHKFINQKELAKLGIIFSQLPYAIGGLT